MRLSMVSLLMILTTVFLSGCTKTEMATLDDRSGNFYAQNGVISGAFASATSSGHTQQAAPVGSISARELTVAQATAAPRIMPKQTANWAQPAPVVSNSAWQWPVQGQLVQRFGKQGSGVKNEGIVIAAAQGAPIRAAQAGDVAYVGNDVRDYGNMVILRHAGGEMSSYAHASDIIVKKGQHVGNGDVIGHVGTSGGAKTPQLHFALHEGASTIDPLSKLPSQVAVR